MSRSKKHVTIGALDSFPVPEPGQEVVQVTEMRGTNLVQVLHADGNDRRSLCLMPAKFRKTLWIKRGNYLIIEPFTELCRKHGEREKTKIKGRIVHVLFPDQVKHLQKQNLWPSAFSDENNNNKDKEEGSGIQPGGGETEQDHDEQKIEGEDGEEEEDKGKGRRGEERRPGAHKQKEKETLEEDDEDEEEDDEDDYLVNPNRQQVYESESESSEEEWEY